MSESLVDVEEETATVACKAVVKAYVDAFLEFPAIADAVVRQSMLPAQGFNLGKHLAGSGPQGYAVALPHMLAQLYLQFHNVLVAVAALVVASHPAGGAGLAHHAPGRIAIVEARVPLAGYHAALPYLMVVADGKVGGGTVSYTHLTLPTTPYV